MSDWDASDSDSPAATPSAPSRPAVVKPAAKSKWEGEDEDNDNVASDWEESEEEEEKPAAATVAAPPKKKMSVKQKIAEREAAKAANGDNIYDEDAVLDPRARAKRDKERELESDLRNAADLLGGASLGSSDKDLDQLLKANPKTKEEFQEFSAQIIDVIIKRHQHKPLYATFVEYHVRELSTPLKDVEVRKAASGLTTLANEKQREQRDKSGGKKKTKGAAKPVLGSAKATSKVDTSTYDEAMDDFGADDFM